MVNSLNIFQNDSKLDADFGIYTWSVFSISKLMRVLQKAIYTCLILFLIQTLSFSAGK